MDPDRRIQESLDLVFSKMTELGSARQVLLWFRREKIRLPAFHLEQGESRLVWKLPIYHTILEILTNPLYAGAYAYGKTETRTRIVEGQARKTDGHHKHPSEWIALIQEARWNAALQKVRDLEKKLQTVESDPHAVRIPSKEVLLSLAQDLPAVWDAPSTDMRLKQRIVRILIREIVADIDEEKHEIVLILHWAGGRHSELRTKKNADGRHRRCTSLEAVDVARRMAGRFSDEQIASTLNRLGMRTGAW